MSFEYSLHEIEAMRMKRIHAGTGEREPVRVWEIKPIVRTAEEQTADNQSLLGFSAGILKRAIARGTVKLSPVIPVEPGAKPRGRQWTLEQRLEQARKIVGIRRSQATRQRMAAAAKKRELEKQQEIA